MKRHYKESPQCLDRDIELALALLEGAPQVDRRGLPKFVRLTTTTKPTEKEAREALCRVLASMAHDYPAEDRRSRIFAPLMSVFLPSPMRLPSPIVPPSPFRATLKRYNQGRAEPWRDFIIAREVRNLMEGGLSYDDAAAEAAKKFKFGKDPRHVKKIYGRWRRTLDMSSDRLSDDMASDN